MNFRKRFAAALITAGVCAEMMGASAMAQETASQGVFINDTDVSGMTYQEISDIVKQKVVGARTDTITVQVGEDSVQTTASDLGLNWQNKNVAREAISLGNSGNAIKRYKDIKDLNQESKVLTLEYTANETAIRKFIEESCMQFEKEAQEASITADGGAGVIVTPGITGQVINVEESVKAVQDFVANQWQGGSASVALSVELDEPKGDNDALETIQDCLGSYTTVYGSDVGRNVNVERGAELINGHVIEPGETFSVCDHLVPFSAENGYELGGAYENGRVVQEYGGGICQVSTTLYNALLLAELEIVQRSNHTMSVSYVPTSMDAAIAEGYMDLVFRNNLDTPIFISGYAYGGELTFAVWGQETRPEGRSIEYVPETTSQTPAPTQTQLVARPDLPVGYFNQVQSPMGGSSASLYKYIYYNGETTVEHVNDSHYQATSAIVEVGTSGASDALMQAIYQGDYAAAQQAATGVNPYAPQTPATDSTQTPSTDATQTPPADGTQTPPTDGTQTPSTDPVQTEPPVVETPPTDVIEVPPADDIIEIDPGYTDPYGGTEGAVDPGVVVW